MTGIAHRLRERRRRFAHGVLAPRLQRWWEALSYPVAVVYLLLLDPKLHPGANLGWAGKSRLAARIWRTTRHVPTATSAKAHLAMAAKLLAIPPEIPGVVVECGCFAGGSTANLSLVCDLIDRELIIYDSFEGMPAPERGDLYSNEATTGMLRVDLDTVRENVRRFGAPARCTFREGWFKDTLPDHGEPIVFAFLDVDFQASLDECVRNLWPHLTERGYMFIDEYVLTDYCALFWSERWWQTNLDAKPPGLIGSGTGLGVGQFYLGPFEEWTAPQDPTSVAYTRKDFSGHWSFYPGSDDSTSGAP